MPNIENFSVVVYGQLTKFTEVISKARCRIFYKGLNRNGSYISDEFAEKLVATLPYTPIKGIYDQIGEDYGDHGQSNDQGRIYGIVPQDPNLQWETHLDSDGIEREYACVDVLIFTALYAEASEIVGKPQSMELYPPSVKGEWIFIQGQRAFKFTDGCFFGLQVLGEEVEPCFEGAAFFSFCDSLKNLVSKMEQYNVDFEKSKGGQQLMPTINFKISDNQKFDALWSLLNVNYTEEGNWTIEYGICDIYDDYAIVKKYEDGSFSRVYYTKNDEDDSITIDKTEACFMVDVTEDELRALKAVQAVNNGTYEKIDETFSKIDELTKTNTSLAEEVEGLKVEKENFELKIGELNDSISTLTTEKENFTQQISDLGVEKDALNAKIEELSTYKANIEKAQKTSLIESYSKKLAQEVLDEFSSKIDEFSYEDLDKELAYSYVKNTPTIFSQNSEPHLIPKDEPLENSIEAALRKYEN